MKQTQKKIGLITFFKSQNYGVWFQAYATEKALEKIGYSVEVIDYTNLKEGNKANNRCSKKLISCIKSLIFGGERYYKQGFLSHIQEYYKLSGQSYHDIAQMQGISYDVLIAGSDQIWNPETTSGELDRAFLLQFGSAEKRISIASSIGSSPVREMDKEVFQNAFRSFDAISVRENFAKTQLQELTDTPIKIVCDPTLLLDSNEWLKLAAKSAYKTSSKYILTYFVSTNKRSSCYQKCISDYANTLNLPVWSVQFSTYKNNPCEKIIVGATVADFVKLIANAALVITDSFHGVAMSVNLNTDFVAIENRENPVRVKSFLDGLELADRIDMNVVAHQQIDYEQVNLKIQQMRRESLEWIKTAIDS